MAEKKNPVITIEMTNGDIIKAELYMYVGNWQCTSTRVYYTR